MLLRLLRDQREPDVRFALNVSRNIAADISARSVTQVREIAAEIIDAGRRPPEADGLSILVKLLARVKIVGFQQRLCALQLFVGVIVLVVEMGDLVVDSAQRGLRFFRSRLRDDIDRSHVSLRVVADRRAVYQPAVNQIALKTRVGLLHDEREDVGGVSRGVVLAD